MNKFSPIELDEKKLAEKTLQYIYSIENTYKECLLFINILNPLKIYENLKSHESYLKERLSKLHFIIDYDEVTFENRINGYNDDTFEQSRKLANKMFAIENFSKEVFWANENEENIYQNISNFNCFETKIISNEKLNKTILNAPYNLEGWTKYYQDLLRLKFAEFSEEIIIDKKVINYRHFKEFFFLGIETDYKLFKNNLVKNINDGQPYHKLIIFKKVDKKKIERIITFDKFIHPHFDPPAYSFSSYFYEKNTIQISDVELSLKYIIEKEFLDNGNVKLYMSEKFGDHLKRHAYFYYDMLYHTTKEFIKFVEESFEAE